MKNFFNPSSIAVIGASHNARKLGNVIAKNLIEYKYRGKVYPVNPRGGRLYGKKVFKSIEIIPDKVDLAVIVIPATRVIQVMKQCGAKGIKSVVIISAGFSEQNKKGRLLERQVLQIAKKHRIRILGPNCLGIIIPRLRMNASFAQGMPLKGSVAVISQSGAMAVAITDWAMSLDLGFSALVSLGNKIDLQEEELIAYFSKDKDTQAVVLYLESLATGRSLLRTIKRVTRNKPVIIIKPGQSDKAKQAVASHTGALAGEHKVQNAALSAAGAIVVQNLQELFMYTRLFRKPYRLNGNRLAIITNAGGPGVLATDSVAKFDNLVMADFQERTIKDLKSFLPEAAAVDNPVDLVGDATTDRYKFALKKVLSDPGVDVVLVLLTHQYVTEVSAIAREIVKAKKSHPKKPILSSFMGGRGVAKGREILTHGEVVNFSFPEQAVKAVSVLYTYYLDKDKPRSFPEIIATKKGRLNILQGQAAERLVKRYIKEILPSAQVKTVPQALQRAGKIGYPVVAKVISKKIVHKTDKSAVKINITTPEQLSTLLIAWKKELSLKFTKDEGFLIQPYQPGLLEVFIGAKRDPKIGPYLIFGLGGIFVESLNSQQIIPLPLNTGQVNKLLTRGSLGKILKSQRGRKIPQKLLTGLVLNVSKMMMEKSKIVECDLNPVILDQNSVRVADVRLVVSK